MFQDGSDRVPTYTPLTLRAVADHQKSIPQAAATSTAEAVPERQKRPTGGNWARYPHYRAGSDLLPRSGKWPATSAGCTTPPFKAARGYHPAGLSTSAEPVVALHNPGRLHAARTVCCVASLRRPKAWDDRDSGHDRTRAEVNAGGGLCGPVRLPLNGFTYS